ncbi:MAG TPA: NAD(P)/FAD-dependent oxidoreductase [Thermoanaerobaculia bacterium]|nr:NAD(P)/FAD-dependent oxidoreductase [Thermoanaerobaculia bacterium]
MSVPGAAFADATPRVVIVGAGFGGLTAARTLRRTPVQVTVVDRRNHHLFQPLLYQVATAALSPGDIAYPIRSVLRRQSNTRVLLADAERVDVSAREVVLTDGRIGYDYLILATGSRDSYFGHDDWRAWAPGLKDLDDALEIRRRILLGFEKAEREPDGDRRRALLTFVLVGGGPTGVELAGAIAEISRHVLASDFRSIDPREARILLVEAGPRILPAFPERLSAVAERDLRRLGVEVRTGAAVTAVGRGFLEFAGQRLEAETVLWNAGVTASTLVRSLGAPLDRAGRVIVQPDLSIPGHAEVFVIGDAAAFLHQTGRPLPGVAQPAIQQGRCAARNITRRLAGKSALPFVYRDLGNLAVLGRSAAIADLGWLRFSGYPAWLFWCFVHIMKLVGFRNRFIVFFEWAWSYFSWQRGARLITGAPSDAKR